MKPQVLLLVAHNNPNVAIPDGVLTKLHYPTEDRNELDGAGSYDPVTGHLTIKRAGLWEFKASAEVEHVDNLTLRLIDTSRSEAYTDFNRGPSDSRIVCAVNKRRWCDEGDEFFVELQQFGSSTATLWPYRNTVHFEAQYFGY